MNSYLQNQVIYKEYFNLIKAYINHGGADERLKDFIP